MRKAKYSTEMRTSDGRYVMFWSDSEQEVWEMEQAQKLEELFRAYPRAASPFVNLSDQSNRAAWMQQAELMGERLHQTQVASANQHSTIYGAWNQLLHAGLGSAYPRLLYDLAKPDSDYTTESPYVPERN